MTPACEGVLDRGEPPAGMNPSVGDELQLSAEDGARIPVVVTEASETSITLDANHPLAGHALTFEIELIEMV